MGPPWPGIKLEGVKQPCAGSQTEKDEANHQLEKRLWDAADQFRANSGLKAGEYSGPVLGLIFLRFAEARFAQRRGQLEKAGTSARRSTSRIERAIRQEIRGSVRARL